MERERAPERERVERVPAGPPCPALLGALCSDKILMHISRSGAAALLLFHCPHHYPSGRATSSRLWSTVFRWPSCTAVLCSPVQSSAVQYLVQCSN
jgi:hypothetical protein